MNRLISMSLVLLLAVCFRDNFSTAEPRFCGEVLNDVLSQLCTNGYNSMLKKRSSPNANFDPLNPIQYTEDMALSTDSSYPLGNVLMPNMYQENALSSLTTMRRRLRSGIIHECCDQGCSFEKLFRYCRA